MNNMLKTLKEYEDQEGNISYYEQTMALKKNSVIDKLLIDRTIAEKKEEYMKQQTVANINKKSGSLDHSGQPKFDGSLLGLDKNDKDETPETGSLNTSERDEFDDTVKVQNQGHLHIAGAYNKANTSIINR